MPSYTAVEVWHREHCPPPLAVEEDKEKSSEAANIKSNNSHLTGEENPHDPHVATGMCGRVCRINTTVPSGIRLVKMDIEGSEFEAPRWKKASV